MTFEEKKQRWDFVCSQFNPYEHIKAMNAFISDSPVIEFKQIFERFKNLYKYQILDTDYESFWDYMRFEFPSTWFDFCENITFCIELCSRFGDVDEAMKLLRYQEENNLRSEQPSFRL